MGKRVLVCGGRNYSDKAALFKCLDQMAATHGIDRILHGDALGADRMAGEWACLQIPMVHSFVWRADWHAQGRSAGPIRNQRMLDDGKPDIVVACTGGRGTADMVRRAETAGVPVIRV